MLAMRRVAGAAVALLALAAFTGCSSGNDSGPDATNLDVNEMRGALLQATDIGPTWTPPDDATAANPTKLPAICGGTAAPPAIPPGGTVVAAPFVDEGDTGAQSLYQTALVYGDDSGAKAAYTGLKTLADNCPATVNVPA